VTLASIHSLDRGLPSGVHGAADPRFTHAIRAFGTLFPARRLGGGALAVYLDGRPVVDVWTGWADRRGEQPWSANTGAVVFSATKGLTATVIHRLVDRGVLAYDMPVAEYWPAFGANDKAAITVREVMGHRAGLSHLNGASLAQLLDHRVMEARLAAAPAGRLRGQPAYHALTFGWLMSGLARAVTGMGMRELIRLELALPLNTDGLHLGRPPAGSALSDGFGAIYSQGMKTLVQGDIPMLDAEMPSVNGVATARALAKGYAAIANGGQIGGTQFLSGELARGLTGKPSLRLDRNCLVPLAWHLGYHAMPFPPGVMPGFGHAGANGSLGWADPATGMAFAFVHNRLLTPMVWDQTTFIGLALLLRRAAAAARAHGPQVVADLGAPYPQPGPGAVAG
jgi:CubicO group peptidase (beta-lactamase class C family)